MVEAIFSFLCSILISLGGSVTSDNIGQDFATIYSNQDPSVQQKMDEYFYGNPGTQLQQDIFFQGTKLTTEMLYNIQNGNVSNEVIQESVGIDGWKNFIENNQNNVIQSPYSLGCSSYTLANGNTVDFYIYEWDDYWDKYSWKMRVTDQNGNITFDGKPYQVHYSYASNDLDIMTNFINNSYVDKDGVLWMYWKGVFRESFSILEYIGQDPGDPVVNSIAPGDGSIGSVDEYPIAADGSITLPDGTVITPNADGTYTINGNVYSPSYNLGAYNDSALLGLLSQILQKINDLESKLEFEQEGDITTDEDLAKSQEEALNQVNSAEGVLSSYTYASPKWTTIFPFCIPWDFVRGVKLISSAPVAPKFSIPFEIPSFGQFPGYKTEIVLDFSEYEKYFQPVRWFTTIFFLIGLGFITFKIVKGAA